MNIERLPADWGGEGAEATHPLSASYAERLLGMLPAGGEEPEPMHHANGNVGLYWRTGLAYVDVECWPDGKVAYYIENGMETTKGSVSIGTLLCNLGCSR